ncbi:uncharacterized protein LOC141631584 [Silene latifolia]|uniref:uncharacterized protein LOC141631584 n=1 Tax=Silene latifolia TaxID=37657 RepID=UPI003D76F5B9
MPGEDQKSMGGPKTIPVTSPLYLHPSNGPNLIVTQIVFDGSNYDLWADAVKNGLDAKNKLAFIEGKVKKPEVNGDEEESVEAVAWRHCNATLRAGLRNVIDPKLHASISFNQPIKDVWEELRGRYLAGNAPRVHQLKGDLSECKQGKDTIVEYYTRLKTIWDELANYSKIKGCTCGAAASIAKEHEEERVHQLLMGLDSRLYGNIKSNLLMEDPIAPLNRVYALVLREERHVTMTKVKEEQIEAAMAAKSYGGKNKSSYNKKENDESNSSLPPFCTHCEKYYHTEANCYDKHGYDVVKERERGRGGRGRSNGRSRGRGRGRGQGHYQANAVGNSSSSGAKGEDSSKSNFPFTSEEVERIRILLSGSPDGTEKLQGMKTTINVEWMIDSGASHHMTGRRELLENCWTQEVSTVSLPDGRQVKAQDPTTRMMIGRGEHRQGVYYYKPKEEEVVSKKGWKIYDLKEKRVFVSRDVNFFENVHPFLDSDKEKSAQSGANNEGQFFIHDVEGVDTHVERGSNDTNPGAGHETGEVDNDGTVTVERGEDNIRASHNEPQENREEIDQPVSSDAEQRMGRGAREKFEPSWKKDYYCKSMRIITPTSHAHHGRSSSLLSGMRYPLANYVITNCFSNSHQAFLAKIDKHREPNHYHEAAKIAEWREAMKKEIDALEQNGTWKIVKLPEGKKPIGCKWVYKIKYHANGTIERYKARLVAQGFTQIEGVDFHETYAPVAKMTSVRCMLAIA